MKRRQWASSFDISKGKYDSCFQNCNICCFYLFLASIFRRVPPRSSLPDIVFDEGERQPKQTLKRSKSGKVRRMVLTGVSLYSALCRDLENRAIRLPISHIRSRRSTNRPQSRRTALNGRQLPLSRLLRRLKSKPSSRSILLLLSLHPSLPQLLKPHHQESQSMRPP